MRFVLFLLFLAAGGCATLPSRSQLEARCDALSSRYQVAGAIALAAGSIAGAGGLTNALPDDQTLRVGVGATAAALTAAAIALVFIRDDVLEQWSSDCVETSTVSAVIE